MKEIHVLGHFTDTIDGHEKNIVLKLKQGSGSPNDSFLTDLAEAVATAAKEAKIGSKAVVLDQDWMELNTNMRWTLSPAR